MPSVDLPAFHKRLKAMGAYPWSVLVLAVEEFGSNYPLTIDINGHDVQAFYSSGKTQLGLDENEWVEMMSQNTYLEQRIAIYSAGARNRSYLVLG